MFERFTDRARRVIVLAQQESRLLGHGYIGTEHLLLGLLADGGGTAAQALESLGVTHDAAREQVREMVGEGQRPQTQPGHIPFTPPAKKVLELSLREAQNLGDDHISTEHHRSEAEEQPGHPVAPQGRETRVGGCWRTAGRGARGRAALAALVARGHDLLPGRHVALPRRGSRLLARARAHAAQPRVHPLVDLFTDPLDKTFGHRRLVARAEFSMGRHGGGDLITLVGVHAHTLRPHQGAEQG